MAQPDRRLSCCLLSPVLARARRDYLENILRCDSAACRPGLKALYLDVI
jgi:hypothetical protein